MGGFFLFGYFTVFVCIGSIEHAFDKLVVLGKFVLGYNAVVVGVKLEKGHRTAGTLRSFEAIWTRSLRTLSLGRLRTARSVAGVGFALFIAFLEFCLVGGFFLFGYFTVFVCIGSIEHAFDKLVVLGKLVLGYNAIVVGVKLEKGHRTARSFAFFLNFFRLFRFGGGFVCHADHREDDSGGNR